MSTGWMFNKINVNDRITYMKICSIFKKIWRTLYVLIQRHSTLLYDKFQLDVFKNAFKKRFFFGGGGWMGSLFILTCIKICGHVKTSLLISQRCVEMLRVTFFLYFMWYNVTVCFYFESSKKMCRKVKSYSLRNKR